MCCSIGSALCFFLALRVPFVSLLASCVFISLSFASLRFVSSLPCWQMRQICMCCCLCHCISFVLLHFALFCFVSLRLLLFVVCFFLRLVCFSSLFRVSAFFVFRQWFSFLWVWTTTPEPDSQLWYVRACALVSLLASFCFTCFSFVFLVLVTFDCSFTILQFCL